MGETAIVKTQPVKIVAEGHRSQTPPLQVVDLSGNPLFTIYGNGDFEVRASTVELIDVATMDLTSSRHTLASSSAARTFGISFKGDDITLEVTLNAASATYTFPATALCVSEGTASGDNTLSLSGTFGDKYIIAIKKVGSSYYVVSKNFGQ